MSFLPTLVSGLTAITAVGAVIVDHELPQKGSQLFDRSIYRGPGQQRTVALTFDDGPSPQTPQLLAFLQRNALPATFFQCGMQVERYPELARQVSAHGHEIGNHTWSHMRLVPSLHRAFFPSPKLMHRELARTQRLLTEVHGKAPRLFRPPYGDRWIGLDAVQQRLSLRGIQWTVIGHDWEWPADRIAQHVLARIVPGAIVCLHDGRDTRPIADLDNMMGALRLIVPALRDSGYGFQTVTDLLKPVPELTPLPEPAPA